MAENQTAASSAPKNPGDKEYKLKNKFVSYIDKLIMISFALSFIEVLLDVWLANQTTVLHQTIPGIVPMAQSLINFVAIPALAIFSAVMQVIIDYVLAPAAAKVRRASLFDVAYGVVPSGKPTRSDYYCNNQPNGLDKLLANTFESSEFTMELMKKSSSSVYSINAGISVVFIIVSLIGFNRKISISLIQFMLSGALLINCISHFSAVRQLESLSDEMKDAFRYEGIDMIPEVKKIRLIMQYQHILDTNKVATSTKIYDKHKDSINEEIGSKVVQFGLKK
ncbi:MAG: hypothetical protein FWG10_01205 [Eubacteriaceae bacterium]|nr:hypothetical protein [Eubacteriaceae bacterium]